MAGNVAVFERVMYGVNTVNMSSEDMSTALNISHKRK